MTEKPELRGTDAAREAIRRARGDEAAPQIPILFARPANPEQRVIGTVPPEIVNAIIRDPDSPLYPCQIGVYCDECGTHVTGDYMVSAEQTKAERLDVARGHLRAAGWICDERGDYCPMCARPALAAVLAEVAAERAAQDAKWGEQNHPDGTGNKSQQEHAGFRQKWCESAFGAGYGTWAVVLAEEVAEAEAERDPAKLRSELLQVAAVAVAWIEAIDRRTTAAGPQPDTCATVEVDGEPVRVRGQHPMSPESQAALAEVVGAARRKYAAEHPATDRP